MRVAVLGAGYAGLTAARRLERRLPDDVDIVVVDESDTHLVQHELHRVVRHPGLADAITVPLADALDRAEVRRARVTGLDADAGVAELDDGTLEYDYGVLALGARTAFFDLPGVAGFGLPLKRLDDARAIRESFLDDAVEADDAPGDPHRAVVGGAGLSGVQVAGELAALADEEGIDAVVTLVEQMDHVAPGFRAAFRRAIREELEDAGVAVRTGAAVDRATGETVHLATGEDLPYDTFVWTGGIRGSDATAGERPTVRADLRLGERTFAVGDAARVVDANGEAVPASAAAAIREAPVVATNVARLIEHERSGAGRFPPRLDRYTNDVPGWVVSVGDAAVAQVGRAVLRGPAARAAKATVGAGYLGSVGSVRRATDLVREELGWPGAESEPTADEDEPVDEGAMEDGEADDTTEATAEE